MRSRAQQAACRHGTRPAHTRGTRRASRPPLQPPPGAARRYTPSGTTAGSVCMAADAAEPGRRRLAGFSSMAVPPVLVPPGTAGSTGSAATQSCAAWVVRPAPELSQANSAPGTAAGTAAVPPPPACSSGPPSHPPAGWSAGCGVWMPAGASARSSCNAAAGAASAPGLSAGSVGIPARLLRRRWKLESRLLKRSATSSLCLPPCSPTRAWLPLLQAAAAAAAAPTDGVASGCCCRMASWTGSGLGGAAGHSSLQGGEAGRAEGWAKGEPRASGSAASWAPAGATSAPAASLASGPTAELKRRLSSSMRSRRLLGCRRGQSG